MDQGVIDELDHIVPGAVSHNGEPMYDTASALFNHPTFKPRAVVTPKSVEQLALVVRFLKENELEFAIRSGGHNNIAYTLADGIILIDLSNIATVKVIDQAKGLVEVGGGALARTIGQVLDVYSLGIASGDSGVVGVGGLATGGGIGWLIRKYGPLVDDIIAAEVVTADGEIVEAREDSHADLLWAIRGGGSNFGIVTRFTLQAHPISQIFEGVATYSLDHMAAVLTGWRDAMRQAPLELTTTLKIMPANGTVPAQISIRGCFIATDQATAEKVYAPFFNLGGPLHTAIEAKRYVEALEDAKPSGRRSIARSTFFKTFSDEVIETITSLYQDEPYPIIQIRYVGGVMNSKPADMTAFSHRDSEVLIYHPNSFALDVTDEEIDAALWAWRKIKPLGSGSYINMTTDTSDEEIASAYLPSTLKRLQSIKATYDPDNMFKNHFNIKPHNEG